MNSFWGASYSGRNSGPKKIFVFNKQNWHWSLTITLLGWFVGVIAVFYFYPDVLMKWYELLFLWLAIGTISMFIHIRIPKARSVFKILGSSLFLIYNFFGLAPITLAIFLLSNIYIQLPVYEVQTYRIIGVDKEYDNSHANGIRFILEDFKYDDLPSMRHFDMEANVLRANNPYLQYEIGTGFLGLKIRNGRKFVNKSISTPNK